MRIHARDAASADRDLSEALELRRRALGDDAPAGALMFTCNGRGRGMFGLPDHDAGAVAGTLGDIPTAGFFAAGEIGPVGGEGSCTGSPRPSRSSRPERAGGAAPRARGERGGVAVFAP